MAKLVIISGAAEQREFMLRPGDVVGRSSQCEVVIPGPLVSRRHARVSAKGAFWSIEDLDSGNGTFVNGRNVRSARLHDGDWVRVGDHQLTFVLDDDYVPPEQSVLLDDSMGTVVETVDASAPPAGEPGATPQIVAQRLRNQLQVIREVAEEACGALSIDTLVERVLSLLLRVYPQADHAHAILRGCGEEGRDLTRSLARRKGGRPSGLSRTLLEMATRQRKAVLADTASEERLQMAQSLVDGNVRLVMCSPLMVRDSVLGALQVDTTRTDQRFEHGDLELLAAVAGQLAVAAENSRLHRELAAKERLAAVGQAISGVAHCVKNALNSMTGGSYILELGLENESLDRVAKGWDMVSRNTGFLKDLVKDMLVYCRRGGLRPASADVEQLLRESGAMVQESAAQKGIDVSVALQGDVPEVRLDALAMKRVLLNLLVNAVEACGSGCRITLGARFDTAERTLHITVADDGPGMPEDVREQLFEPFFTTKGSRGTGLGLAVAQKVIQDHQGSVQVESEVGRGTSFEICLPIGTDKMETKTERQ